MLEEEQRHSLAQVSVEHTIVQHRTEERDKVLGKELLGMRAVEEREQEGKRELQDMSAEHEKGELIEHVLQEGEVLTTAADSVFGVVRAEKRQSGPIYATK